MIRHIEFIGIPGCGKSTLHAMLSDRLEVILPNYQRAEAALMEHMRPQLSWPMRILSMLIPGFKKERMALPVFRRSHLPKHYIKEFLKSHGIALDMATTSQAYQAMQAEEQILGRDRFLETAALYQCLLNTAPDQHAILFDEGLVQRSMGLFLSPSSVDVPPSLVNLHQYLSRIPCPKVLVFIQAPVEECLNRMKQRDRGLTQRLQDKTEQDILDFLHRSKLHFEQVAKWFQRNSRCRIIQVDSQGPIDVTLNEIQKQLMPVLTGARVLST